MGDVCELTPVDPFHVLLFLLFSHGLVYILAEVECIDGTPLPSLWDWSGAGLQQMYHATLTFYRINIESIRLTCYVWYFSELLVPLITDVDDCLLTMIGIGLEPLLVGILYEGICILRVESIQYVIKVGPVWDSTLG